MITLLSDFDPRLITRVYPNFVCASDSAASFVSHVCNICSQPNSAANLINVKQSDLAILFTSVTAELLCDALGIDGTDPEDLYNMLRVLTGSLSKAYKPQKIALCFVHDESLVALPVAHTKSNFYGYRTKKQYFAINYAIARLIEEDSRIVHVTPVGLFSLTRPTDVKNYLRTCSPLNFKNSTLLASSLFRAISLPASVSAKLIVCDLDNTLWGGTLREVGFSGITVGGLSSEGRLYEYLQSILLYLKKRGLLLALVSKNSMTDVEAAFEANSHMPLALSDFVSVDCSDSPKSTSIIEILANLNISPDHVIFMDDSTFERHEVSSSLPSITILNLPDDRYEWPYYLAQNTSFSQLFHTYNVEQSDGANRTDLYKSRLQRLKSRPTEKNLHLKYTEWLQSLRQMLSYKILYKPDNRTVELFQRTNQFNTASSKHSFSHLENLINSGYELIQYDLSDIHGSDGIVGVTLSRREDGRIEVHDMLLSCRAFNRNVEYSMVCVLIQHYNADCDVPIIFRVQSNGRNLAAISFLKEVADKESLLNIKALDRPGMPSIEITI
jgi:FkbH-like protein